MDLHCSVFLVFFFLAGDDVSFVFPDFKTVLRGTFEDGIMKEAWPEK